ncbi:unnamed protein product [marine sediment metagenome]|uniref:Uncharacterized protein n=1 Tax=marine sediment metagenome TaxID=412755 RepID=X0VH14_9ZZZZ
MDWVADRFPCDVGQDFDLICAINCFELWDHADDVVDGIKQRLKPKGTAIVGWTAISDRASVRHMAGPWLIQADKIIDTRRGRGVRFDWIGPPGVENRYQVVGNAFREGGFAVTETHSWLAARPAG